MADITTVEEFKEQIEIALGDLSTRLESNYIEFAIDQALDETGFSYPLAAGSVKFWGVQRAKRHAIDILRTTSAYKFKYKQISLNQRFDHLDKMIEQMDEAWKYAIETDPELMDVDIYQTYGTYL
jgi:hypothetical protein